MPPEAARGGKYGSRRFKFVERVDYRAMTDFIVYIDQPVPGGEDVVPGIARVIAHKNASFVPHVLPIVAGTTVEWPNLDTIHHNAFSFSEAKPFDLGLYKDEVKRIVFDQPGRVDVFCSIHKSMHSIIFVVAHGYFSQPDRTGRYTLPNVPAGTYRLKAWHERMPPQVREVEVPEQGEVRVDFTLSISSLPNY